MLYNPRKRYSHTDVVSPAKFEEAYYSNKTINPQWPLRYFRPLYFSKFWLSIIDFKSLRDNRKWWEAVKNSELIFTETWHYLKDGGHNASITFRPYSGHRDERFSAFTFLGKGRGNDYTDCYSLRVKRVVKFLLGIPYTNFCHLSLILTS